MKVLSRIKGSDEVPEPIPFLRELRGKIIDSYFVKELKRDQNLGEGSPFLTGLENSLLKFDLDERERVVGILADKRSGTGWANGLLLALSFSPTLDADHLSERQIKAFLDVVTRSPSGTDPRKLLSTLESAGKSR
ncbi:MAG: hypothetical protein V1921_06955 [Candidatus Altiarchaeota archaeon]